MSAYREGLGEQAQSAIRKGDRVITPRDEVGFITRVTEEGFAMGEYAGALSSEGSQFTLHARLLVRWKPEAPRPKPYRAAWVKG